MSDEPADIYTLLKRSRLRGVGLRLTKEQVIEIYGEESEGVQMIAGERKRQIREEGFTPEHDDEHRNGELALAAAVYAWTLPTPLFVKKAWPWDREWYKPWPSEMPVPASENELHAARIRRLSKAGALIAAEIERLKRTGKP